VNEQEDLDPETQAMEERDRWVNWLIESEDGGERAAWEIVQGKSPDVAALERWAEAMEVMRQEIADGRLGAGWIRPTEADVEAARDLARRAREGASPEELRGLALRVYRVTADPNALYGLCHLLGALDRDVPPKQEVPSIPAVLDRALAFFERGGEVAGFSPTPEDVEHLRRLQEVALDPAAAEERLRLTKALIARMPNEYIATTAIEQGRTGWDGIDPDSSRA
jgi:hypothetical protein